MSAFTVDELKEMYIKTVQKKRVEDNIDSSPVGISELSFIRDDFSFQVQVEPDPGYTFEDR